MQTLDYLRTNAPRLDLLAVMIPEGSSLREASLIWQEAELFSADAFLDMAMDRDLLQSFSIEADSFEGWLFPDTYLVPKTMSARQAVELMASQFFRVLSEVYPNWQALSQEELRDRIILASIVQKEHRVAADAPLMASVFLNRLAIGMRLETDATLQYARKERQGGDHRQRVLLHDLRMDDPYNTYQHHGMPPGPIGMSGRIALQAAFLPPTTNYFYFVVIPETGGRHHFSTTYEEHLRNARIYWSWLDRQGIFS